MSDSDPACSECGSDSRRVVPSKGIFCIDCGNQLAGPLEEIGQGGESSTSSNSNPSFSEGTCGASSGGVEPLKPDWWVTVKNHKYDIHQFESTVEESDYDRKEALFSASTITEYFEIKQLINQLAIAHRYMDEHDIQGEAREANERLQRKMVEVFSPE